MHINKKLCKIISNVLNIASNIVALKVMNINNNRKFYKICANFLIIASHIIVILSLTDIQNEDLFRKVLICEHFGELPILTLHKYNFCVVNVRHMCGLVNLLKCSE